MKIMKTSCALIGVASVLVAPSVFAGVDGTISLGQGYGNDQGGGVFIATTSGLGTFGTFCLEFNEEASYGTTYNYMINSGAVNGGVSTAPTGTATFDPISIGTAYLYSQFFNNVAGYYGTPSIGNALQQAIWWLEAEGGTKNYFITAAETALGLDDTTIKLDANGAYGVVALNVTDANGGLHQDVLAVVPEASTVIAGALLLLPLGVSAVRIVRKNRVA